MVWLLRHGDAEDDGGDDAARRLTPAGERQAEQAGLALAALGVEVEACLSSPKVRAIEMARLACRHLGVEPQLDDRLAGGGFDVQEVAAGHVAAGSAAVLLVGHEPDMSEAIAGATGGAVKLSKGGIGALEDGVLYSLMGPAELAAIAEGA
jgi:phosphohistidine phosphatase